MRNPRRTLAAILGLSMLFCVSGCATHRTCPKERSFSAALQMLGESRQAEAIREIRECGDADALRMVAFAARAASWPGEAGPDVDFDNRMEAVEFAALGRLFDLDSDEAKESLAEYERSFPPDGAFALFFEERGWRLRPHGKSAREE